MRHETSTFFRSLLIATVFLGLPAHARTQTQTTPSQIKQESDKEKIQAVEIKAKSEVENQRRDAAAKSIVSNADLTRYGDTNITEAMKRVPGVVVIKGVMQLPGLISGYTQILVDGEPPRGVRINDIPMQNIERVEIYRLGSAEFSSQGVAGTINIILKKIPKSKQQNITFGISHETNTTPQVTWTSSDKWVDWSYSVTASARQYVSFSLSETQTYEYNLKNELIRAYAKTDNTDFPIKNFYLSPAIQYSKPNGINLNLTSYIQASEGENITKQEYSFQKGNPLPYTRIQQKNKLQDLNSGTTLKLLDKLSEATKIDLSVGLSGRRSQFRNKDSNFDQQNHLLFDRLIHVQELENYVNTSLKLSASGNEEHDIVGGLKLSSINNRQERNQELTGNNTPPELTVDNGPHQNTRSVVNNFAAFIQDEWRFHKESSAYFGLRWETVTVFSEGSEQISARNTSRVWSPIVQTLWQLNSENTDRMRFGISRTFKAPGNFFLVHPKFVLPNNSEQNPNIRGNPLLKPELAWAFEASYEHNDAKEFSYSAKFIVRSISDLHRMQTKFIDDFWWRQVVNSGEGISKRIDLNTQFPLKRFWEESPNINLSFDISKNWSSVSYLPAPDNKLTSTPFNASLNLDYTARSLPLSIGGSWRYRQAQPYLLALNQRSYQHSEVDLDLYTLWKFSQKTQLRLAIDNVLNRQNQHLMQWFNTESQISQYSSNRHYRKVRLNFNHGF